MESDEDQVEEVEEIKKEPLTEGEAPKPKAPAQKAPASKKKKKDNITVNIKTEYKKTETGEYVITGLKIDSPRSLAVKGQKPEDEEEEEKPKEGAKAEEKEEEHEEKKKGKKKGQKSIYLH
jgi:hypothetical protein